MRALITALVLGFFVAAGVDLKADEAVATGAAAPATTEQAPAGDGHMDHGKMHAKKHKKRKARKARKAKKAAAAAAAPAEASHEHPAGTAAH